jgi:hypothetical protein
MDSTEHRRIEGIRLMDRLDIPYVEVDLSKYVSDLLKNYDPMTSIVVKSDFEVEPEDLIRAMEDDKILVVHIGADVVDYYRLGKLERSTYLCICYAPTMTKKHFIGWFCESLKCHALQAVTGGRLNVVLSDGPLRYKR